MKNANFVITPLLIIVLTICVLISIGFAQLNYLPIDTTYSNITMQTYDFTSAITKSTQMINTIGNRGQEVMQSLGVLNTKPLNLFLITFTNNNSTKYAYMLVYAEYDNNGEIYYNSYNDYQIYHDQAYKIYAYIDYDNTSKLTEEISNGFTYWVNYYAYNGFTNGSRSYLCKNDKYVGLSINRSNFANNIGTTYFNLHTFSGGYNFISMTKFDIRTISTYGEWSFT